MSELLTPGQELQTGSGLGCKVEAFLGGGGQGEVYRASYCGTPVALKYFFPHIVTEQMRAGIEYLVQKQAPDARFLWPLEIVTLPGQTGFGYLMPLRPPRYKNIVDLMKRRIEPSFQALCMAGMQLADSFLKLHSLGLCYRDISFGNAFFDPDSGETLICDNDNVSADGTAHVSVLGTPRFMAPEVVIGDALPSTHTDLYSLAVLLFYFFVIHHPLEGAIEAGIHCMDLPAMNRLYGHQPIFIFDPDNDSNRPVPGLHNNALLIWPILPASLRQLFTRSFTEGIRDPLHGRVRESEWRNAMSQIRDQIFYCACGAENFYERENVSPTSAGQCWSCQQSLQLPMRMRLDQSELVMLNRDTRLYPHHTLSASRYDYTQPEAEMAQHPQNPQIWGLKNLSQRRWVLTMADGSLKDVDPGRSATLSAGLKIDFGGRK
ncbi:MAG: serine/threonine protein kinase, partial [Candidatus Melainabacteria bacterium HGW-Melainabacteria-1]